MFSNQAFLEVENFLTIQLAQKRIFAKYLNKFWDAMEVFVSRGATLVVFFPTPVQGLFDGHRLEAEIECAAILSKALDGFFFLSCPTLSFIPSRMRSRPCDSVSLAVFELDLNLKGSLKLAHLCAGVVQAIEVGLCLTFEPEFLLFLARCAHNPR
ncbi:hypothetical protein UE98_18965 [Burkholderia cenocepacia]|nr:hypothetical protein UE98_18965 [Burkholderia cenocepacia]